MTAPNGELRIWATVRRHERHTLPALRAMLELPFEHVLVSHGEPVHDRAAFEARAGAAAVVGGGVSQPPQGSRGQASGRPSRQSANRA